MPTAGGLDQPLSYVPLAHKTPHPIIKTVPVLTLRTCLLLQSPHACTIPALGTYSGACEVISVTCPCCFDGAGRELRYESSPLTGSSVDSTELSGRTQCFSHKWWIMSLLEMYMAKTCMSFHAHCYSFLLFLSLNKKG